MYIYTELPGKLGCLSPLEAYNQHHAGGRDLGDCTNSGFGTSFPISAQFTAETDVLF